MQGISILNFSITIFMSAFAPSDGVSLNQSMIASANHLVFASFVLYFGCLA
jgi:hypothetical protein